MIDVEVRNFQSIEHATLQINGFTALVGKSNIGKSALVRAIKYALTGTTGTHFVRHGVNCARTVKESKTCECFCSVTLRAPGFELVWEKGDKKNRYFLNGAEYGVPSRGTPDFLEKPKLDKDFSQVKVGESSTLLQVADQFDNTFLLNQSGVTVADVISDVAHLDCVNGAIRLAEKDRREAASTRKVREQDLIGVIRDLGTYDGLDRDVRAVDRVEGMLTKVSSSETAVSKLSQYVDEVHQLGFRVDRLQGALGIPIPEVSRVLETRNKLDRVGGLLVSISDRVSSVKSLMGVENVPVLIIDPLVSSSTRQIKLNGWVDRLRAIQKHFAQAKTVEDIADQDARDVRSVADRLIQLCQFLVKQQGLQGSIDRLAKELSVVDQTEKELSSEVGRFKKCPTCHQYIAAPTHTHGTSEVS